MTALLAWCALHHQAPVLLVTFDDVDWLVDRLSQAPGPRPAARLALHPSVQPSSSANTLDQELVVGVDPAEGVGSLRLVTYGVVWYAQGKLPDDGNPVAYQLTGSRLAFPPDSLVPLDDVPRAVKDFLINSGCRRPVGLDWVPWPDPDLPALRRDG